MLGREGERERELRPEGLGLPFRVGLMEGSWCTSTPGAYLLYDALSWLGGLPPAGHCYHLLPQHFLGSVSLSSSRFVQVRVLIAIRWMLFRTCL
jgi:hypothetical protein